METTTTKDYASRTLIIEAAGEMAIGEDCDILRSLTEPDHAEAFEFALVDLSGVTAIENLDAVLDQADRLRAADGPEISFKTAVVLSDVTLALAHLVQTLQERGVWATDFTTRADARDWLYDAAAARPAWMKRPRPERD